MTDIVERWKLYAENMGCVMSAAERLANEMAKEIERLRSDIGRLEKDCGKLYEELAERDQWY